MSTTPSAENDSDDQAKRKDQIPPLVIPSTEIFRGRSEVWIEHGKIMYRLRLTGTGKLYLCK
ncbi:hemin uptake protein HemP [Neorhodopirellula pilleata]|uniref:hemin uptake protein HemP n=1 Tax=Neorhodopirellula pilleata TaxID=2714738 RepID=UPI0011B6342E|nr:hemin uptake protein HemP [Neorhodopirellula pilleata]